MRIVHNGLKRFVQSNDRRGIVPGHAAKLRFLMDKLSRARTIRDVNNRTLHALRASFLKRADDCYAVNVSAQWRLVFDFKKDGGVDKVDYVNYH